MDGPFSERAARALRVIDGAENIGCRELVTEHLEHSLTPAKVDQEVMNESDPWLLFS
jgi:hypothetical protein